VPTYVTDVATSHGLSSSVGSNIPIAAYGVVLIVVMLLFPQGIQGGLRRLARQFLPTPPTHLGSPGRRPPAGEAEAPDSPYRRPPVSEAEDPDSPYRRPPVSEHQEEGTS
jgi:branched-chain amino acid transport system permease protein